MNTNHSTQAFTAFSLNTGIPVSKVIAIDDGFVVLLDPFLASRKCVWDNLVRLDKNGAVVWRIAAPASSDIFVGVVVEEFGLRAWTWHGHKLTVSLESGSTLSAEFVK